MTPADALAEQLLEAQVAHAVDSLTAEGVETAAEELSTAALRVLDGVPLEDIVTESEVAEAVVLLLERIPPSTTGSTLVAAAATVIHQGPPASARLDHLLTRDQAAAVVDEVLGATPVITALLDQAADSPMVGTAANRFLMRVVNEVVAANRSVAERIPGVGGIFSLGDKAAAAVIGAAEVPLQLVGDTAGKGAALAVRRLTSIVVDTLHDPALRAAIMEVWDQQAGRPLDGRRALGDQPVGEEDAQRLAGLAQDITITASTSDVVREMARRFVAAFFDVYGAYPVTTLLEEMGLDQDEVQRSLGLVTARLLRAGRDDGTLALLVRRRLQPFYRSADAVALIRQALADAGGDG